MKSLKLIALGIILFASSTIYAQVSVNINIGTPPLWGPIGFAEAEYYYLPDVEAYYDIRATQFIYYGGGRWIRSRNLPNQYRNYDLYDGYKVVLNDYHGSRPYNNFRNHKTKYYKGYHGREQRNIGYRNNRDVYVDQRQNDHRDGQNDNYRQNKNYENKGQGKGNKGQGKGNDNGRGQKNGKN